MKNLYKIEDELYIISNTEDVNENCWIITDDRLVQVCYLLSDEIAKGNKVILTTNKLLIKDGVQAIDEEFLEWFVKNPSCERVEFEKEHDDTVPYLKMRYCKPYKTIIPKEEPKQETLEEVAAEFAKNHSIYPTAQDDTEYGFINGAKWKAERMYSEEDIIDLIQFLSMNKEFNEYSSVSKETARYFLEQFKKK